MDTPEHAPKSLPTFGIISIAFGLVAGLAAPFATNGPEFVMTFASAAMFGVSTWIMVRAIGYFSNPNRSRPPAPPDNDSP
jgi:hypothetical protein